MSDYYDQPTARLENDHLILDYLTAAGPRIVRLIPRSLGENLLAETPDLTLDSPHGPFHLRGGHRLWHAPESRARTYVPDDAGLRVESAGEDARLIYDEPHTGIRKELAIALHPTAARVRLLHRLTNVGLWPVELAPWAITQMRLGGRVALPTAGPAGDELLPDRLLAVWPYSRWDDPRLRLTAEAIEVDAHPAPPLKLGTMSRMGRIEYHYGGLTFVKRWTPQPGRPHVDFGCNAEVYAGDRFVELETLGPLVRLEPGEEVEHVEEWEIVA